MMDERRLINQYIDGRMTVAERARFEAELARSPELAADVANTREAIGLLRGLPLATPPADLTGRIMSEVRARPLRPTLADLLAQRAPRRLTVALAGAVTVLVAAVGVQMMGEPGEAPTVVVRHSRPVELSRADNQFVADCLVDYQTVAVSSRPSGPPSREE